MAKHEPLQSTGSPEVAAAQEQIRRVCAQHLGLPVAPNLQPVRTCRQRRIRLQYQVTLRELLTACVTLAFVAPEEAEAALIDGGASPHAAVAVVAALSEGTDEEFPTAVAALHRLLLPGQARPGSPHAALPRHGPGQPSVLSSAGQVPTGAWCRAGRRCGRR